MITKKDFLKELNLKPILFDGAMGTEIYKRGVFINKCYDELNLSNPALIKQIHTDYKKAGADVLETNTFGANLYKLKHHQLQDKVYQINYEAARLANEIAGEDTFVAGAIGPLGIQMEPLGPLSREEAVEAFTEQAKALLDGGVDLFVLETFIYPEELRQAVKAVRNISDLPIIGLMTIDEAGNSLTGASPEVFVKELESFGADVIGVNCTVGPHRMLNWLEKARTLTNLPISVMPNAGKPRNIDGRNIYMTSPEYLGEYAKHFIQSGANVIGGCCGTNPEHIKAMRNAINAIRPTYKKISFAQIKSFELPDVKVIEQENKSRLASRIKNGLFIKLVELLAPHGVSASNEIEKARNLYYQGIDAINIPDGPRASARMSALSLAIQIQRDVGIEAVLHYVCRDRNVIGIQSDLLGASALGIKNILAITGDPPKLGNYPDATGVFDVDSIGLVNILSRLNHGLDIAGNPIGKPSAFFVGVGANPGAINLDEEIKRLEWKIDAGAEFIITQPVFDLNILEKFIKRIEHIRRPLVAGLWPLTSIRNAEFMNNEVPGCNVPENLMERMRNVEDSKEKSLQEGILIARETLEDMKEAIQGVQISAPFGRIQTVFKVLDGIVFK
ncbi:MAG: bifunctional homocysteine S-methyltransferase/methylenetetrahydrofolate reductase [bacterium]